MTDHAARARDAARDVADTVRAELARQRRTAGDLAVALGVTPHTVGKRLNGTIPFDMAELYVVAAFLSIPITRLTSPASNKQTEDVPA